MRAHRFGWLAGVASMLLCAVSAHATPQTSLEKCQKTVKTEGTKFVAARVKAVEGCLAKIAKSVIKDNGPAGDAASSCVSSFRKLNNTADPTKTLEAKMTAKIVAKCDPATPGIEHTLQDILGTGAGVPQPINAENINTWCARFGGDGAINTLQEWIDCVVAANECAGDEAISTHFPRALQWFDQVRPAMVALIPSPTDAVAALDAVNGSIEGANNDNVPNLQCGSTCGDGVKDGTDQCDGTDLGGQTCLGLGYSLGGTLACAATCGFNTGSCVTGVLPATGQTTCWNASGVVIPCAGNGARWRAAGWWDIGLHGQRQWHHHRFEHGPHVGEAHRRR